MLLAGRYGCRTLKASISSAAAVGARRVLTARIPSVQARGMFVQKLNPLTGEADWVLVNDPGLGADDDASSDLVATSSYLDMLTDSRRNVAYHAALRRVLPPPTRKQQQQQPRQQQPGISSTADPAAGAPVDGGAAGGGVRVLDIGTGTGLLAMMAARALGHTSGSPGTGSGGAPAAAGSDVPAAAAEPGAGSSTGGAANQAGQASASLPPDAPPSAPVVACEVFPPMQNLARRVVAANDLSHVIRIVNKRSDEFVVRPPAQPQAAAPDAAAARIAAARARAAGGSAAAADPDMYGKADVIVTEIFDSELLGEGMIPTMRHAVQHLLKEGGVVIPATSRVYGQVVRCPLMHRMTGLRHKPTASTAAAAPWAPAGTTPDVAAASGAAAGVPGVPGCAAAARVLEVLGELDAGARAAAFRGEDLYEVREMHVDLLYEYDKIRQQQHEQQHHGQLSGQAGEGQAPELAPLLQPLSEPFLVFDFDWLRPPPPSGRRTVVEVPVTGDGDAHAVLLWWQLGMVPEGLQQQQQQPPSAGDRPAGEQTNEAPHSSPRLLLSTAPVWLGGRPEAGGDGGPLEGAEQQWRDHWKQCWGQLADEAPAVHRGDVLRLAFEHDDLNIRHKLLVRQQPPPHVAQPPQPPNGTDQPSTTTSSAAPGAARSAKEVLVALQAEAGAEAGSQQLMPLLSWLGPQALLQLGDLGRLAAFGSALHATVQEVGAAAAAGGSTEGSGNSSSGTGPAEVVVVDGSLALGLLAATHPAVGSVTLLQDSNVAASNWLRAAASRLGVAGKIKSLRSESYFKRLAAAAQAPRAAAASTTTTNSSSSSTATPGAQATAAPNATPGPLVLISEPYFSEFEQLVPWAHLKFWRDYDVIRGSAAAAAPVVGGTTSTAARGTGSGGRRLAAFPRRARLVAVAAALPDLWRTRCALGNIEGLDLSAANTVLGVVGAEDKKEEEEPRKGASGGSYEAGASGDATRGSDQGSDEDGDVWGDGSESAGAAGASGSHRQPLPILPYSVWQAGGGYRELSGREQLLALDCGGHLDDVEGEAVLTATHGSVCHAVVLWMDFDLLPLGSGANRCPSGDSGSGEAPAAEQEWLTVSTAPAADGGPGPTVQGVYLLQQPVELTRGSRLHVAAQFDGLDADVSVEVTVLPPL